MLPVQVTHRAVLLGSSRGKRLPRGHRSRRAKRHTWYYHGCRSWLFRSAGLTSMITSAGRAWGAPLVGSNDCSVGRSPVQVAHESSSVGLAWLFRSAGHQFRSRMTDLLEVEWCGHGVHESPVEVAHSRLLGSDGKVGDRRYPPVARIVNRLRRGSPSISTHGATPSDRLRLDGVAERLRTRLHRARRGNLHEQGEVLTTAGPLTYPQHTTRANSRPARLTQEVSLNREAGVDTTRCAQTRCARCETCMQRVSSDPLFGMTKRCKAGRRFR